VKSFNGRVISLTLQERNRQAAATNYFHFQFQIQIKKNIFRLCLLLFDIVEMDVT